MKQQEKEEILFIAKKSLVKLHETHSLMKDGKFIVAYEKLGGIIKILSDFGGFVEEYEVDNPCSTVKVLSNDDKSLQ